MHAVPSLGMYAYVLVVTALGNFIASLRPKSVTPVSPYSKSVTSWRGQKSVVSVVSCSCSNSITTTCCQQVGNIGLRGSYGETCLMDFGHHRLNVDYLFFCRVTHSEHTERGNGIANLIVTACLPLCNVEISWSYTLSLKKTSPFLYLLI